VRRGWTQCLVAYDCVLARASVMQMPCILLCLALPHPQVRTTGALCQASRPLRSWHFCWWSLGSLNPCRPSCRQSCRCGTVSSCYLAVSGADVSTGVGRYSRATPVTHLSMACGTIASVWYWHLAYSQTDSHAVHLAACLCRTCQPANRTQP
jgi:hypothetical protein